MHLSIRTSRQTGKGVWLPLVALVFALSLSWWPGGHAPKTPRGNDRKTRSESAGLNLDSGESAAKDSGITGSTQPAGPRRAAPEGSSTTEMVSAAELKPNASAAMLAGDSALPVLVIDAGHGGGDPGSPISDTLFEKDVALDVALRLGRIVTEHGPFEVVYTRDSDTTVPLEERTDVANKVNADLFLSIHVNKSPVRTASGPEMYILFSPSRVTVARSGAKNAGTAYSSMEVVDQIRARLLDEKMRKSKLLAERLQPELRKVYESVLGNTPDRGIRTAPFVVLIGTRAPAVVAEVGFASGPEARLLSEGAFRGTLAAALYQGLIRGGDESLARRK